METQKVSTAKCDMGTFAPMGSKFIGLKGAKLTKALQQASLPQQPGNVPPSGAAMAGTITNASGNPIADVYYNPNGQYGDAKPAALQLLQSGALIDSILSQVSGVKIPRNQTNSNTGNPYKPYPVYVSGGGSQGAYGAYHFSCHDTEFVLDSLKNTGAYMAPVGKTAKAAAQAAASGAGGYLTPALFAAELTESYEAFWNDAHPNRTANGGWACGNTNGEAMSRMMAFLIGDQVNSPIDKVSGFSGGVSQYWWQKGHPDYVNDNSMTDQSTRGNGCGVMFLNFLNSYLGISMKQIWQAGSDTLGDTYAALAKQNPTMAQKVAALAGGGSKGMTGQSAFKAMINLLTKYAQNSKGQLNLPANGNPYPSMPGAAKWKNVWQQMGIPAPNQSGAKPGTASGPSKRTAAASSGKSPAEQPALPEIQVLREILLTQIR
jgi:hypothetical protein